MMITEVFCGNFDVEEERLLHVLDSAYNTIAFDTEYPGTIINTPQFAGEPERYKDLKLNVERTNLIQVGFTLFNPSTSEVAGVWQFNLSGFDPKEHVHSPDAIGMLTRSGVDFTDNNVRSVKMYQLVRLLKNISDEFFSRVQWVAFHDLYDAAYMVAAVQGKWKLPWDISGFSRSAGKFFNGEIFDLKCMAEENNLSWM